MSSDSSSPSTTVWAHEQIHTALEVERFEVDLFRSKKNLWLPNRARGVFGGQVISQALVSATQTVDPAFGLHVRLVLFAARLPNSCLTMHCYFLLSASATTPIVYFVERLRDGRSYSTRAVKALQNGRVCFTMLCSFHKPEPWQPTGQWSMPPDVPAPEKCVLEEVRYAEMLRKAEKEAREGGKGLHPKVAQIYREVIAERSRSPIAVKSARELEYMPQSGMVRSMYWFCARDIPAYEPHFQKCILAYMSDLYLLGAVSRMLKLERYSKGPNAVSMTSTIDHSICFYEDNFDCGDWLLYMASPRAAQGRGIVYGQLYTRTGTLVGVTTQEGVVRADRRGPEEATTPSAKL
ncbi:Acyl-coenzyme A thioesterase 8 [Mycena kentingensis (nom. inval.)]|nr:Acyl-coenzyme A thioesterase 8 [Mycena kentingensis (nom. inval.)]